MTHRGARWAVRAVGATVAVVLVACCGQPHPNLGDLEGTPGASTRYPGAVVYQRGESQAQNQVDGPSPATITVYACTHDPAATVQAWFDRALTTKGWQRDPQDHHDRPGAFQGGTTWKRGDARFDLNFATAETTTALANKAHQPSGCPTGYETLAQIG